MANMSIIITTESTDCSSWECGRNNQCNDVHLLIYRKGVTEENDSLMHTRSSISHVLDEDKNGLLPDAFGPSVQEHKCNLANISGSGSGLELSRKLTPREVFHHNRLVGCKEWLIYKDKVYDSSKLKEAITQLVLAARKDETLILERNKGSESFTENNHQHNLESCSHLSCSSCSSNDELVLDDAILYIKNGIRSHDLAKMKIYSGSWCIGCLVDTDALFWDDLRSDVTDLINDLIQEDCQETLSPYQTEYLHLLQRWINKYRNQDPEISRHFEGDSNLRIFSLPGGIKESPESLRPWMQTLKSFDFDLPQSGAWNVLDIVPIDLGNCHDILLSTLKSGIDLSPFDTTFDGEAAWEVIDERLFAEDIMTDNQKKIEYERKNRTHFFDSKRMEKRRQHILQYFIFKYKYDKSKVSHFLNWATEMKNGEDKFLNLCENF